MNQTISLLLTLAVITIVVSIVANIELAITKRKCVYSGQLMKGCVMLSPEQTGLSHPCWIYNSKYIKGRNIAYPNGHNKSKYAKRIIDEHFASKLNRPIGDFLHSLASVPKSKMPLNSLYNAIMKGEIMATNADPMSNSSLTNYRLIHSKQDRLECFISGNEFFILPL